MGEELGRELRARCDCLIADLEATLGLDWSGEVYARARQLQSFLGPSPLEKLTEDIQQRLHDERISKAWPACPRHRNHPLWPHGNKWVCERDGVAVADIGALGRSGGQAG